MPWPLTWTTAPLVVLLLAVRLPSAALGTAGVEVRWSTGRGAAVHVGALLPAHCWSLECSQWKGISTFVGGLAWAEGGVLVNGTRHAVQIHGISIGDEEAEMREAVRSAVQDIGLHLFIGLDSRSSASSALLAQAVVAEGGVLVTPAMALQSANASNPQGSFFFGLPVDRHLATAIELLGEAGASSVAFLSLAGDEISSSACAAGQALAQGRGMAAAGAEALPRNFSELELLRALESLRKRRPQALVACLDRGSEVCFSLPKALEQLDFDPKALVLTDCLERADFVERNAEMAKHILGVIPWTPSISWQGVGMRTSSLTRAWYEIHQTPPTRLAIESMAACELLVSALQFANSDQASDVAAALRALDVDSLLGRVKFNAQGAVDREAFVVQHLGSNTFAVVAPREAATQTLRYPRPSWSDLKCDAEHSPADVPVFGLMNASKGRLPRCQRCPQGWIAVLEGSVRRCRPCGPGTRPDNNISERTSYCASCPSGRYNNVTGAKRCKPCPVGRFVAEAGSTSCVDCSPGKFARFAGFTLCRGCDLFGERFYNERPGGRVCFACPVGGLCEPDGDGLYTGYTSLEGFYSLWDEVNQTKILYECVHDGGNVCIGRDKCAVDEATGEPGMGGPFCGSCLEGYARQRSNGACLKCGSFTYNLVIVFVAVLVTTGVVMGSFLSTVATTRRFTGTRTVVIRQVLSYVVLASAGFQLTDHDYPLGLGEISLGEDLLSLTGLTTGGTAQLSASCFLREMFPGVELFKICAILGSCLAPFLVVLELVAYKLLTFVKKLMGRPLPHGRHLVGLIVITLYVLLPRITGLCLMPMDCFIFDQPRLLSDTRVLCLGEAHAKWKVIGYMGFIGNSMGIPLIMLLLLYYYKRKDALAEPHVLSMLGFLYTGLEPSAYYFGCIYMMRNVVVEFVASIPFIWAKSYKDTTIMSCASLSILHGLFLILHLTKGPYDNRVYFLLDRVETASLLAIWSTTMLQTWLQIVDNSRREDQGRFYFEIFREASAVVVFLLHLRFWLLVLFNVSKDVASGLCSKRGGRSAIMRACTRWLSPGRILVTNDGFRLEGLSEDAQKLCGQLFAELLEQLSEDGTFEWEQMRLAMHYVFISAYHERIKARWVGARPLFFLLQNTKESASHIPLIGPFFANRIERVMTSVSHQYSSGRRLCDLQLRREAADIEHLSEFSQFNADNVIGRRFTVEELYNGLLRLGKLVKDPEVAASDETEERRSNQIRVSSASSRTTLSRDGFSSLHADLFSPREMRGSFVWRTRKRTSTANAVSSVAEEGLPGDSAPVVEIETAPKERPRSTTRPTTRHSIAVPSEICIHDTVASQQPSAQEPEPGPEAEVEQYRREEDRHVNIYGDMARLRMRIADIYTIMEQRRSPMSSPRQPYTARQMEPRISPMSSPRQPHTAGQKSQTLILDASEFDLVMRDISEG